MDVTVNGVKQHFNKSELSILELIKCMGIENRVVVALNSEVISEVRWAEVLVKNGDSVEALAPMVGG